VVEAVGFYAGIFVGAFGVGFVFQAGLVGGAVGRGIGLRGGHIFANQAPLYFLRSAERGVFSVHAVGDIDDRLGWPRRDEELIM
jgi:hypothetical protein